MTTPDLYDEVDRAARITARRWPGVIDAEDVGQEIWVILLEKGYMELVEEMEPPARAHVLGRIGSQVASRYRDDYEVFSGNVSYGTDEVRAMLKAGLLARQRKDLDPSSETLTEFLDLHEGAALLRDSNARYAGVVADEFLLKESVEDRKLVTRAVDALTVEMNRVSRRRFAVDYDGPGSRQAVTNSTAQHITRGTA